LLNTYKQYNKEKEDISLHADRLRNIQRDTLKEYDEYMKNSSRHIPDWLKTVWWGVKNIKKLRDNLAEAEKSTAALQEAADRIKSAGETR
jgi:hypothetical protein